MSTRAQKTAARPVNSVNDELVGEEDGDIVDAPVTESLGLDPEEVRLFKTW